MNAFTIIEDGRREVKVVIPGGSGELGTILARALLHDGNEVVVLSRHPQSAPWRVVAWDGVRSGPWSREVDGAEAVINLQVAA